MLAAPVAIGKDRRHGPVLELSCGPPLVRGFNVSTGDKTFEVAIVLFEAVIREVGRANPYIPVRMKVNSVHSTQPLAK